MTDYTWCSNCNCEMEFIGFENEEDNFSDEIYRCPKCGEESYVN